MHKAPTTTQESQAAMTEAALLARMRAGDDAAFDEFVDLAGGRMLVVARGMLRHEQDAQDAVQEAFLNAFRSLPQFDGLSLLTTWIHRITVNTCLMKLRTRRRKPEQSIDDLLPRFLPDGHRRGAAGSWKPIESAGIETDELRSLVRDKIEELPEMYRVVLLLRDVQRLDTDEAATALGINAGAVKTRLHRARLALKELLDPLFSKDAS